MSTSIRKPWESETTLDQTFLNNCADNLCTSLEMIAEIELASTTIYASDRNKYVGDRFYEALVKFPLIERTIGDWLANEIEFSTLTLELSNVDGRFNSILPSGNDFSGWVGKDVTVKIGLRDVLSTYRTLFKGKITSIGGFKRNIKSITIIARDNYDSLNINIPNTTLETTTYPYLENDKQGKLVPFILGSWNTTTNTIAIPAIVVNGNDPNVYGGSREPVEFVISTNALSYLDITKVYLRRASNLYQFQFTDIFNISPNNNSFSIVQNGFTIIEGSNYEFATGDEFFCSVIGPTFSGKTDNIVTQAKYLLETFGGLVSGDFDSSWTTYEAKNTPAVSAIASIKSRVYISDLQNLITYVRSMLQQVRIELFINNEKKLQLKALHYDEFIASPSISLKNWDIEKDSFNTEVDDRNNINRGRAVYAYEPITDENTLTSNFFKNNASITQIGKAISKEFVYPNLYVKTDVENQLKETLKLTSTFFEIITCNATWRLLLVELGDFIKTDVKIGATEFNNVPCFIRTVGYDPNGFKVKLSMWSLQMFPFGLWNPGYSGIVSGASATITEEI